MESHRQGRRLVTAPRSRQRGITFLGLMILAVLVGVVGLAGIKLVPMYVMDLKLSKALEGISDDVNGKEVTPQSIQYALAQAILRRGHRICRKTASRSRQARTGSLCGSSTRTAPRTWATFG